MNGERGNRVREVRCRPWHRAPRTRSPWRPSPAWRGSAGAAAVAALTVVTVSCAPGQGPYVEGAAPEAAPDAVPVYVRDTVGEPLVRPERFAVTESVSVTSLTWETWGGPEAVATGRATGLWCVPECPDEGYAVRVALGDAVRTERVAYYGLARVTADPADASDADPLPPAIAEEVAEVRLSVPGLDEEPR